MKLVRHALFVAFHFPPEASSSGVLRTLKFSRYLSEYGWRVTVIAPDAGAYDVVDRSLEAQIPPSVHVVRTPFLNTKRHLALRGRYPAILAVPDTWIGWLPWAVSAGRRIAREDPYDLVFSTSPHATAHRIAHRLARSARVPWVMDFRDPWHEEPPEPGTPAVVHWFARKLERKSVHAASHVVTSTSQLRDTLRRRYPELPVEKFSAILNGFDEADFAALPAVAPRGDGRLVFVHAGNINVAFRDPRPLFRAVQALANAGTLRIDDLRFRFLGGGEYAGSRELAECLRETGLLASVEFVPRVPYEEALRELLKADVLILLQASADTAGLVPAKLYEYLRSGRPVLALVLPGATGEVMHETGGGWPTDPTNPAALQSAVQQIYRAWREGSLASYGADLGRLKRFDRRALTRELASIFDALASGASASRDLRARPSP